MTVARGRAGIPWRSFNTSFREMRSFPQTYDTADVAFDAAVAVVTVRVGASAVFARHRTGLDPAAAAAQALHAAAVHTEPVVIA